MATYVSAQSGTGFSGSATPVTGFTFTLPAAVSAGNSILVVAGAANPSNNVATLYAISDSGGTNTYTQFDTNNDETTAGYCSAGFYCLNSAGIGGGSPSISLTNASHTFTFPAIIVDVFNINTPVFDAENSDFYDAPNPGTGANAIATLAFSPTHSGDLIWGAVIDEGSFGTMAHGTGFTLGQNNAGSSFTTEYKLSGASGSQKVTFTDSTHGASSFFQVFGLAIQQTAASTVWTPRRQRHILQPTSFFTRRTANVEHQLLSPAHRLITPAESRSLSWRDHQHKLIGRGLELHR